MLAESIRDAQQQGSVRRAEQALVIGRFDDDGGKQLPGVLICAGCGATEDGSCVLL
jgi:hypothetical protein